ncbi:MAG: hypothetical protein V4537_14175 [Pseudomonadota bacterium]
MSAPDWDRLPEGEKEAQRDDAYDDAHPRCEHCGKVGCLEDLCPSFGCCGLPLLCPSEIVHEKCLKNWNDGDEPGKVEIT